MDNQRTDRTSGRGLIARLWRVRIGLRLMLLLVALFCVLCAYYRACSDLRRAQIKFELTYLEDKQRGLANMVKYNANASAQRVAQLAVVNTMIEEKKRAIGEK